MRDSLKLCRWIGISAVCCATWVAGISGCGSVDTSGGGESGDGGSSSSSGGSSSGVSSSSGGPSSSSGGSSSSSSSSSGGSSSSGSSSSSSGASGGMNDGGLDATRDVDAAMKEDSTMAGDSAGDANPGDSGGDSTMSADAADATDSAMGNDGSLACTGENSKCNWLGDPGLCKSEVCSACAFPTDDAHCQSAYGSASTPYLCLEGHCAPGECRTNIDCLANPNGSLCTYNHCVKCGGAECSGGNTGGPICDGTTGRCVGGACAIDAGAAGGAPETCAGNALDICCMGACTNVPSSIACCPGAGAATYCATKINDPHATCVGNTCTACPDVPTGAPNYLVDPNGGSDLGGTGDQTTAGCAFKTITRALQVIGASPLFATTITVLGPSTLNADEAFPITLPANVTVTTTGGAVHIDVPNGLSGFTLSEAGSGLTGGAAVDGGAAPVLTIGDPDGGSPSAAWGIVVDTGSGVTAADAPLVSNLIVTNFSQDGILVQNAGIVRIGAGVTSTRNGSPAGRRAGLHVTDNGQAIIEVASGAAPTHFDANTNHGIRVDSAGSVSVTGAVTDPTSGTGTVTTNRNYAAGLWIEQTPGTPPANAITGLVAFANTNGNGIGIIAGSSAKIRASVSLANQGDGVLVSAPVAGSNDISHIDLGSAIDAGGTFGANTFQEPLGSANNIAAGICLQVRADAGTLLAEGNVFGTHNCGTGAGTLTANTGACDNAACAGGVCDIGIMGATGNAIDVSTCTP